MKVSRMSLFFLAFFPAAFALGCAGPQRFATADDAVNSLVTALRNNDQVRVHQILGPDTDELLSSGDAVNDQNRLEAFLAAYDEKHQFELAPDGSLIVDVGNSDWPMPIPVVKDRWQNVWHFDVKGGKEELLNRRIGGNELDTIQTCLAIVDAQREYAALDLEKIGADKPVYAQKIISDPDHKNGLYWPTKEGENPSPLGPLAASAAAEGYKREEGKLTVYHGYYYRILKSQGPSAPGGALNYLVDGKMTNGFALIAWPAQYGSSGITTFIVNHRGILFACDLGRDTEKKAAESTTYDPGPEWSPVKDVQIVVVEP